MTDMLCWIDKNGDEACMELEDDPQPQHPLIRTLPPLITIKCQECNRRLADVRLGPGSFVAIKCPSCNTMTERKANAA